MTNLEKINKAIALGKELAAKCNSTKDYNRIIDKLNKLSGNDFSELDDDLNCVFHDALNLEKILLKDSSFVSSITTMLERRIANMLEKYTVRVRIKNILPSTAIVISPSGEKSEINEYQFHDLRVQIKNIKEDGWKVKPVNDTDTPTEIDTDGRIADWFEGRLFGKINNYLLELL